MFENETVVETKQCNNCDKNFEITDKDNEFYKKISPVFNGEKYYIPSPTLCPDCRRQRRMTWRNERNLYKRKCDATGKTIISMHSPDKPYDVYELSEWYKDNWSALDYGQEIDFDRPFFEQIAELMEKVPKGHLNVNQSENSDYQNNAGFNKNCYLVFDAGNNENCYYCNGAYYNSNSMDSEDIVSCEYCYECLNCKNCYNTSYAQNSSSCNYSMYIYECENCENCIGCVNLVGKSYCIFNHQYSKDEYFQEKEKLTDNYIKEEFYKLKLNSIRKSFNGVGNYNVEGDYINNSKDVKSSYFVTDSEDIAYSDQIIESKDCYDLLTFGLSAELCYDSHQIGVNVNKVAFSNSCFENCNNIYYSDICSNSSDLFGCVGLVNKQYCILNKQYSKEEYEKLVPKIIEHMKQTGEWGEFFPTEISPFGYNETVAQEYYTLTKEEAKEKGYKWREEEQSVNIPQGMDTIKGENIPESIEEVDDSILKKAIICEETGKPFRLVKPELEFYKRHNLPLPRKHPDQRHLDRITKRNPRQLFDRKCDKCSKDMKTTYSSDRPEIVYCEECYNQHIYG